MKIRGKIVKFTNRSVNLIKDGETKDRLFRTSNAMMHLGIGDIAEFEMNSEGILTSGTLVFRETKQPWNQKIDL